MERLRRMFTYFSVDSMTERYRYRDSDREEEAKPTSNLLDRVVQTQDKATDKGNRLRQRLYRSSTQADEKVGLLAMLAFVVLAVVVTFVVITALFGLAIGLALAIVALLGAASFDYVPMWMVRIAIWIMAAVGVFALLLGLFDHSANFETIEAVQPGVVPMLLLLTGLMLFWAIRNIGTVAVAWVLLFFLVAVTNLWGVLNILPDGWFKTVVSCCLGILTVVVLWKWYHQFSRLPRRDIEMIVAFLAVGLTGWLLFNMNGLFGQPASGALQADWLIFGDLHSDNVLRLDILFRVVLLLIVAHACIALGEAGRPAVESEETESSPEEKARDQVILVMAEVHKTEHAYSQASGYQNFLATFKTKVYETRQVMKGELEELGIDEETYRTVAGDHFVELLANQLKAQGTDRMAMAMFELGITNETLLEELHRSWDDVLYYREHDQHQGDENEDDGGQQPQAA